ncbi:MAG: glutamine synthetase family protein [Pseudomonadota bacterium]
MKGAPHVLGMRQFEDVNVSTGGRFSSGWLAGLGLLSEAELAEAERVVDMIDNDRIETLRVLFCDQHGILRGKTITAHAVSPLFQKGITVPSTLLLKDTSHRTVFSVWDKDPGTGSVDMRGANDILLVPRPATFHRLPFSDHSAWILADTHHRSGAPIGFSSRTVLKTALNRLADSGFGLLAGLEVEFHLFENCESSGSIRPITKGRQYLTGTRYGEAEAVLDALRRHAETMAMPVRSVEIEMGPGQFEFTFDPSGALDQADLYVMFRAMVKEVAQKHGLTASFMAKPKIDGVMGSGWHIHQSLVDLSSGRNLFMPERAGEITKEAKHWIAGLLKHARAMCLMTNPTVNSYKRFSSYQLAPDRIAWGEDNRGAMIRALFDVNDPASRIENRVADTSANPHYAFAAQILAGLDGLSRELEPPLPSLTPYDDSSEYLPASLGDAIADFEESPLFREALGEEFATYLSVLKRAEWQRYLGALSEWEQEEYFDLF